MVFSTDKFITTIRKQLEGIADDFVNDMCDDACIVASRLIDETNDNKRLDHMNEISTLAEMCTNMRYDCNALASAFEKFCLWSFPSAGAGSKAESSSDLILAFSAVSSADASSAIFFSLCFS